MSPGVRSQHCGGVPPTAHVQHGPLARFGAAVLAALAAAALGGLVVGPLLLGYRTFSVLSGSMQPRIPVGALVVSRPVPTEALRVGDVITFQPPDQGGMVVTHRIVAIEEGGHEPVVRTKGDANNVEDPWRARLRGGVAWRPSLVVPHAGTLITALRSGVLRVLLLYGGVGAFAFSALWALWRRQPVNERFAQGPELRPPRSQVPAWPAPFSQVPPVPAITYMAAEVPGWNGQALVFS